MTISAMILRAAQSRPDERLNCSGDYIGEVLALQLKGIIYLTPARKYEIMLATKTALPVLEHRQGQSHNLIDRVKEIIKS